ncbi:hypothetical protein [Thermomonas aquatica]|uniref:Uncharacterized protein n=1 Tax=Thermomonas aquatica TaxID=2202149 RepID=A0A5B7ZQV0_9GAMM|nr:hypothetical protein [Thermomonas aquatica]QDA57207.1 hypothetical protein FHQ07_07715 [Thermomonas aquatica]
MTLDTKGSAALKKERKPQFDFTSNFDPESRDTATIKELLAEINQERNDADGTTFDLKSLGTVLRLLSTITGRSYRSITERHPLSTLKTIKLLHKECRHIDAHLIRLLELPKGDSHSILDFFTMASSPEGEDVKRQISRIIARLEKEIDQVEIDQINAISDPGKLREQYRRDTNEAVDDILLTHIHIEDELLKDADRYLTDQSRQFLTSISPLKRESRAHVATCVYLKVLDYVHRLHFELATQLSIPHDRPISNMKIRFEKICADISSNLDRQILTDTNFLSIHEMMDFCIKYMSPLSEIVTNAVGFVYENRAFKQDIPRAHLIIQLYLYQAKLPATPESKPIGVVHAAAAFASVFHQRINKANLVKKSVKYSPKISDPQRQLDQFVKGETRQIPHTVQYLYTERMKWYLFALLERKDTTDSHKSLQLAQSELTRDIFLSLSPVLIVEQINAYRKRIVQAANDFIVAHDKQHIRYEKIRNYQSNA